MEKVQGGWRCLDCLYTSQSSNVKKHVESKHIVPQDYPCKYCDKILKGKSAYNNHLYIDHKKV